MPEHVRTNLARELELEIDKLTACVHCGLCLSACPTYIHLGDENDSPRGRLYLMRAVAEGRLGQAAAAFSRHIDLCLGCRACESVCPSGVRYGHVLETAREEIAATSPSRRDWKNRALRFALNHLFTSPGRLRALFGPARWLRRSGLLDIALRADLLSPLPAGLRKALVMLLVTKPGDWGGRQPKTPPAIPSHDREPSPAPPVRTALFAGCVARELFAHTNESTERVLVQNGCQVVDPANQVCCGALHAHAGELQTARKLARRNIEIFDEASGDAIIVNAAGCGAMMKEYPELLADDDAYRLRAENFSKRVKDVSEFLADRDVHPGRRPLNLRVTYDAPCHLHHAQRITQAPINLIKRIPGIEFVPLPQAEVCCGSAGIYNLLHPELAEAILAKKLDLIQSTRADVLLTGNAGCLMHIASGAKMRGLSIEVWHPVELLARTYE